jgi:hypothetical protein
MIYCALSDDMTIMVMRNRNLFTRQLQDGRIVNSVSKNFECNGTLRSAAGILDEPEIVEDSARDTHRSIAHEHATAFTRDLAAKCAAAGMWFSTAQMWDAVANALQAKLLLNHLRAESRSCVLAQDSESLVQRHLGVDMHGSEK